MAQLLFVYGTLLRANNPVAHRIKNKFKYLSDGKIMGTLYDAGDYPGIILADTGNWVYGSICEVADETLAIIDEYEGYGENQDQPDLYLRLQAPVQTDGGYVNAWVYVYNRPIDGLIKIISGDYLRFLAKKIPRSVKTRGIYKKV